MKRDPRESEVFLPNRSARLGSQTTYVPSIPAFLRSRLLVELDWDKRSSMESTTGSQPASLAWKLALFAPLAVAIVLQVMAQRQTNVHAQVRMSIVGNIFLFVALIGQSLFLMRKYTRWGIVMLIVTSAGLGYGLHVLERAF